MSSDEDRTFMTGGGEQTMAFSKRHEPTTPSRSLTRPRLSPARTTVRQTIMDAVDTLEQENDELRRVNNQIMAEMEHLRAENDQLRKDLDVAVRERDMTSSKFGTLEEDNRMMEDKLRIQSQHFSDENRKFYSLETSLKQDNEKFKKQFENLRTEFSKKESEIRTLTRELDVTRSKLEKASRKNFHDKDVEVFHELEMLKAERKDLSIERDEAQKANKKLSNEIQQLENSLESKIAELRNENRRHSLLTKEFNSLLEENNHLKLQLRRRGQGSSGSGLSNKDDTTTETISEIGSNSSTQGKRFGTARNQSPGREPDVTRSQQRDRSTLLSRDRMRSREKSSRSESSYQGTQGPSIVKESEQEFILDRNADRKQLSKKISPRSRSDSDTSPSPETLPNISGGRTWRP